MALIEIKDEELSLVIQALNRFGFYPNPNNDREFTVDERIQIREFNRRLKKEYTKDLKMYIAEEVEPDTYVWLPARSNNDSVP